jgi:hypothetical protein
MEFAKYEGETFKFLGKRCTTQTVGWEAHAETACQVISTTGDLSYRFRNIRYLPAIEAVSGSQPLALQSSSKNESELALCWETALAPGHKLAR